MIGCPWCDRPLEEHEERDGFMFRVFVCENAPPDWVGLVFDDDRNAIAIDVSRDA